MAAKLNIDRLNEALSLLGERLRLFGGELRAAAHWTFTHDGSPGFRELMKAILKEMNHDAVAQQL